MRVLLIGGNGFIGPAVVRGLRQAGVTALRNTVAWERANPPAEIDPAQFNYDAEDACLD